MIVDAPIWHSRANVIRCQHGHRPRDAGTSTRGNCVRLHACQRQGCGSCVMGIQCSAMDFTIWYAVTRAQYNALIETDVSTPVLELLAIAGYHRDAEAAA